MPPVTTGQIYWGAVPYVAIQCVMVALLIAFPGLVRHDKATAPIERHLQSPVQDPRHSARHQRA